MKLILNEPFVITQFIPRLVLLLLARLAMSAFHGKQQAAANEIEI